MKASSGLLLGHRYRLIDLLATGGMGEVWTARDEAVGRTVAVKVLREEFTGNQEFLRRLRTEARNSAALSHRNIAQMYDYGEQEGTGFLVMELVPGEPLADLLERKPVLPPEELLPILADTARGLHHAHQAAVVHRDVKPGNILIEPARANQPSVVKITDFGVSQAANQAPMTATGMVMGTAQYLSPEQAIGKPATARSDLYALGVIAYEATAGKRPFTGKSPVDIAVAHVNDPVPPLPPSTNPELARVIMRLLSKEPEDRHADAGELADELDRINAQLSGRVPYLAPIDSGIFPVVAPTLGDGLAASDEVSVLGGVGHWKSPLAPPTDGSYVVSPPQVVSQLPARRTVKRPDRLTGPRVAPPVLGSERLAARPTTANAAKPEAPEVPPVLPPAFAPQGRSPVIMPKPAATLPPARQPSSGNLPRKPYVSRETLLDSAGALRDPATPASPPRRMTGIDASPPRRMTGGGYPAALTGSAGSRGYETALGSLPTRGSRDGEGASARLGSTGPTTDGGQVQRVTGSPIRHSVSEGVPVEYPGRFAVPPPSWDTVIAPRPLIEQQIPQNAQSRHITGGRNAKKAPPLPRYQILLLLILAVVLLYLVIHSLVGNNTTTSALPKSGPQTSSVQMIFGEKGNPRG